MHKCSVLAFKPSSYHCFFIFRADLNWSLMELHCQLHCHMCRTVFTCPVKVLENVYKSLLTIWILYLFRFHRESIFVMQEEKAVFQKIQKEKQVYCPTGKHLFKPKLHKFLTKKANSFQVNILFYGCLNNCGKPPRTQTNIIFSVQLGVGGVQCSLWGGAHQCS